MVRVAAQAPACAGPKRLTTATGAAFLVAAAARTHAWAYLRVTRECLR